jgi:glycosyltransferase involved in cell wall biosynthesis
MKTIYTLHEYGAPSHFYGLEFLCKQNNTALKHYELNLYRQLGSSIKRLNINKLIKCVSNILFLISLIFTKNKKIVIGIAPYNKDLKILCKLLKKHQVYYFTSYTCWDQSRMAHNKNYSEDLLNIWKQFTNKQVKHIFAVSELTKQELVNNGFSKSDNITIVNHSFSIKIVPSKNNKTNNFISVGGINKKKGMGQLVDIFSELPNCELTIAGTGKGDILKKVEAASKDFENITYVGFIQGLEKLIPIYQKHSFLILNSHRTNKWEELFGLVIIEAMACGLIPITTDHPGPKEIITDGINGFICKEGDIIEGITKAINLNNDDFLKMKQAAIFRGQAFHSSMISNKWKAILR